MKPLQPKQGDTVIPLAKLVNTTSTISCAINSAIVTWEFNHSWWITIIALIVGAILGWFIAKYIGPFVFPATEYDGAFVVKAGSSALPLTFKAAFVGSISALIISGFVYTFVLGGITLIASTCVAVTIVSLVVGVFWGTLSALI